MNIIYHDPVIEFLKKFKKPTSAKIVKSIDLLEQYGLTLRMPHVRSLSSGLFELRVR
ncbi:type II toxin-antitoxin system RelE/ParE family toxin, partial [Candidatus Gottesmanbacteria bacterium]|nr:type II toxin-antitoxin system RelE/ParE family toxin [Candidatus Gottesmanbacteria bacterium]